MIKYSGKYIRKTERKQKKCMNERKIPLSSNKKKFEF